MINFVEMLGCEGFSSSVEAAILAGNFEHTIPDIEAQGKIRDQVLSFLDAENIIDVSRTGAAKARKELWNRCYSNSSLSSCLPPMLIKPIGEPFRLKGRYVVPKSEIFEAFVLAVIRAHWFDKYFTGIKLVAEFGCGTGHNLLAAANQFPGVNLVGLDWSESAVGCVKRMAITHGLNIVGKQFDFFSPDADTQFISGSGVLTVGALEQVGSRFGKFLDFLLYKKPAICVHIEPIVELYDDLNVFDQLAIKYHRAKGYLAGFLPALQLLARQRRINLLEVNRIGFGSFYHEAYTCVVWEPC